MKLQYYTTVQTAWDALFADCTIAKQSIRFEQFILRDFNPGSIGERFVNLFIAKAKSGVRVRLLLDVVGSYHLVRSPSLKKMRDAGIKIRFISFQFLKLRDILDWTPRRNHRKLAIIDGDVTYIGGVVFSDYAKEWNDFHVRVVGAGRMFAKAFELVWGEQKTKSTFQLQSGLHQIPFSLIGNEHDNNLLYKELCSRIKGAREHITIVTPYFSPGSRLRHLLVKASKRGVSINVVIPARTDHIVAQLAHISYIHFAKKENISIVASKKMNHAKIIYIDKWITFGSSNFDRLSLFYNKELNIQTEDPQIISDIEDVAIVPFFKNTKDFADVTKSQYQNRVTRFCLSIIGYLLRPFI